MKQTAFLLALVILLSSALCSCGRDSSVDAALLDKAEEVGAGAKTPEENEYMGDWTPETAYSPGDLSDTAGIRYFLIPMSDAVQNGMFFVPTSVFESYPHPDGGSGMGSSGLLRLVDLETGEDRALCPDPLCEHIPYVCPYVDLQSAGAADGAPYVFRFETGIGKNGQPNMVETIERLDAASGEFTVVAREEYDLSTSDQVHIMSHAFDGDCLAYVRAVIMTDRDTRTERRISTLVFVDLKTGRTTAEVPVPEEWTDFCVEWMDGDVLRCCDAVHGHYTTDKTLSGMTAVGDGSRFIYNCFDTETGEVFVNVFNNPDAQSGDRTVTLGRLMEGEIEKISLPRDDLLAVEVTRSWIYYTAYDFVSAGMDHTGTREIGFDDGGVIYRVPRSDPSAEPEIVFSDGVSFCMRDTLNPWFVLGDCLYFSSREKFADGAGISFGRNVKGVRVNFVEHTCRYIRYR